MDNTLKSMANKYWREGDWFSFLEVRRNSDPDHGISALNELPMEIAAEDYRKLVWRTWTWTHGINENREEWLNVLVGKRRPIGTFIATADIEKMDSMLDPLVVYRGCCEHNQQGYSWTLDYQRAEWFAAHAQGWTRPSAERRFVVTGKVFK